MFLNVFSAVLFLLLTLGALWFSYPALGSSRWLWALWGPALIVVILFLLTVGVVGLYWLKRAGVVTRPPGEGERWQDLWKEFDKYVKAQLPQAHGHTEENPLYKSATAVEWIQAFREWAASHTVLPVNC